MNRLDYLFLRRYVRKFFTIKRIDGEKTAHADKEELRQKAQQLSDKQLARLLTLMDYEYPPHKFKNWGDGLVYQCYQQIYQTVVYEATRRQMAFRKDLAADFAKLGNKEILEAVRISLVSEDGERIPPRFPIYGIPAQMTVTVRDKSFTLPKREIHFWPELTLDPETLKNGVLKELTDEKFLDLWHEKDYTFGVDEKTNKLYSFIFVMPEI